jgi:CheY-like chemotaxis protein
VVEDNAEAADAFVMLLEQLGHVVEVAYDGPGALEAIERHAPDVAIVDIGLPGMDGYEVARRIVAQQTARRPVLVALTGYGRQEDRLRALDAGFDHHLVKPVELEVLQDLLESIAVRRAS